MGNVIAAQKCGPSAPVRLMFLACPVRLICWRAYANINIRVSFECFVALLHPNHTPHIHHVGEKDELTMPATLHATQPATLCNDIPTFTIGACANEPGYAAHTYRKSITAPTCPMCAHDTLMQTTYEADNLIHICPLCDHIEFI